MIIKNRLRLLKTVVLSLTAAFLMSLGVQAQTDVPLSTISEEQEEYEFDVFPDDLVSQPEIDIEVWAESGARATIHEALKQHADSIDLSAYRLTYDEAAALLKDVIYWDGTLFYAQPLANATLSGGYVIRLYPFYIEHEAEVERVLKRVVRESITPDMSDLQKMLALHNWLAANCKYDYTYTNHTVYDALVKGSSVCQGYKDAYETMLRYVGILEVGTAAGGDHIWNQVKVDGQWYNIDVTWDTTGDGLFGLMQYGNFMISDSQLRENHTVESQDHECTSTLYDKGAWWNPDEKISVSAAVPINGAGSYRLGYDYDSSNMSLIYHEEATGAEKVVHVFHNVTWGYGYTSYATCFGALVRTGKAIFVNDAKSVYQITDNGNVSAIYTYEGTDGRCIFGMRERYGNLELQIGYEPAASELRIMTIPLESYVEEEENVTSFVKRLYTVCLGRKYDDKGLNEWIDALDSQTKTAAEVAQGFFFSDEFTQKNYSDQQYVEILYRTMFDRDGDEAGMKDWLDKLENGVTRQYVYRGFVESTEFTQLCDRYDVIRGNVDVSAWRDRNPGATGFVARLYTKMLGRRFDEDGLEDWCRAYLTGEKTIEQIASDGFLHSQELLNQNLSDEEFVRRMYQTFLNRQPDSQGFEDWVAKLRSGEENRDTLVYRFTRSVEFGNLKASYGL